MILKKYTETSMPEITTRLPINKIASIKKIASQYGDIDRSPLCEVATRAIYWGGTWGLLLPNTTPVHGQKKNVCTTVSPVVEQQWREWLALYDLPANYAIAYLCCNIVLPPLPNDWELGAVAASDWYKNRSVLKLPEESLPRFRHGQNERWRV
jgi:hypothetical protein